MKPLHKKVKSSNADSGTEIITLWQYYVECRIFITNN